jgi:protein-S-isoprenylcysteine O-methyltransferase Ste14
MHQGKHVRTPSIRLHAQGPATIPGNGKDLGPPRLFAWLASLVTISLVSASQLLARGDNPYLRGAGVLVLLLAGVFVLAPFLALPGYGRTKQGSTYMQTTTVVDQGLYAISRHPQYTGYMLLACGFALLSQHRAASVLAILSVTLFYLQAVREEAYCLARLGEAYARYIQRVPRFNFLFGILRSVQRKVRGESWLRR